MKAQAQQSIKTPWVEADTGNDWGDLGVVVFILLLLAVIVVALRRL